MTPPCPRAPARAYTNARADKKGAAGFRHDALFKHSQSEAAMLLGD